VRGGGAWPAILIPAKCNARRAGIRDIHEGVCVAVAVVARLHETGFKAGSRHPACVKRINIHFNRGRMCDAFADKRSPETRRDRRS